MLPLSQGYQLWFDKNDEVAVTASTMQRDCWSVMALISEWCGGGLQRIEAEESEKERKVMEEISVIAPELYPDAPQPRSLRRFGMWRVPNETKEEYVILNEEYRTMTLWHFTRENLRRMEQ